jgi:hypothetical protein
MATTGGTIGIIAASDGRVGSTLNGFSLIDLD